MTTIDNSLTRRRFMLSGGAAALLPLVQTANKLRGKPFQLAIFHPRSTLHTQLHTQFLAGINAALLQLSDELGHRPLQLITKELPVYRRAALTVAKDFLRHTRPDATLVLTQPTSPLIEQFAAANVPLMVGHVGANSDEATAAYSLELANAHFALGQWTVQQHGKRVLVAASQHDSGYDALYAFEQGVVQAGGSVVKTIITHLSHAADSDLIAVWQAARREQPDALAAFYGGVDATAFAKSWVQAGLRLPLVGSRFLAEAGVQEIDTVVKSKPSAILPAFQQIGAALTRSQFASPPTETFLTATYRRGRVTKSARSEPAIPLSQLRAPDVKTGWLNDYLVA